ncbi:MAG: SpoIIE family protein phosphatase, partial [Flavobacteriales bacterium]
GVKKRRGYLYFEGVRIDKSPFEKVTGNELHPWQGIPKTTPEFSYHQNSISFTFNSLALKSGDRLRYQYRLIGSDSGWSDLKVGNNKSFQGSKPGEYRFEVRSIDLTYPDNTERIGFPFIIHPPWWRTNTFYLSAGGTLFLFVLLGVKYRERKLKRQKMLLEEKVQERTEELRKAHDSIQEQRDILEEKNKEISDSINYAKGIQRTVLPSEDKLKEDLEGHFIYFLPKDQVSGDFYWSESLDDGKRLWMAADCTGHGVPGAFMSMISNRLLNEAVKEKGCQLPGDVLDYAKDQLTEMMILRSGEDSRKDGMDGALCRYDPNTGKLSFSGANNPLYLIRKKGVDGSMEIPQVKGLDSGELLTEDNKGLKKEEGEEVFLVEIKGNRMAIAADDEGHSFRTLNMDVIPGDQLYTFSDGFADQFGGNKQKKYRYKPFKRFLLSISHLSMYEQKRALHEEFFQWKKELNQIDDVCIIGKKIE